MAETKLGFFELCPVCHHMTYYPFSDGWMCIQPGCEEVGDKPEEGVLPDRVIQAGLTEPLSKNQRRKANKKLREASQRAAQGSISTQRDNSSGSTTGESSDGLDT